MVVSVWLFSGARHKVAMGDEEQDVIPGTGEAFALTDPAFCMGMGRVSGPAFPQASVAVALFTGKRQDVEILAEFSALCAMRFGIKLLNRFGFIGGEIGLLHPAEGLEQLVVRSTPEGIGRGGRIQAAPGPHQFSLACEKLAAQKKVRAVRE